MPKSRYKPTMHPNLFLNKYGEDLTGRDWFSRIDPQDKKVFASIDFAASDFGKAGGKVRGETGKRWPAGNGKKSGTLSTRVGAIALAVMFF